MTTNRARSYTQYDPITHNWIAEYVQYKRRITEFCPGPFESRLEIPFTRVAPVRYSRGVMYDYYVKGSFRLRSHIKARLRGIAPLPVKEVMHTKVALSPFKGEGGSKIPEQDNITFVYSNDTSTADCSAATTITHTCSPLAFLSFKYGPDYIRDSILENLPTSHDEETTFASVDWAPIADAFDEQCKSLVPSSFFLGETMYESSIFKEALLFVANPSRAVGHLIKDVQRRGLHRMNLGKIANYYKRLSSSVSHLRSSKSIIAAADRSAKLLSDRGVVGKLHRIQSENAVRSVFKEGINLHLAYKFGVVPAIDDIKHMLAAHQEVDQRLLFLNKNRGRYAPIRASRKIPASFTPGEPHPDGYLSFEGLLTKAYTKAVIFGMGKVRDDIHEASRWRAYTEYFGLNKIIGLGWELIPFSFVVDWFTNSQEVVNKLTRIPLGESPFMNIACIGHSIKNVSTYDYICNPGFDINVGMDLTDPSSPIRIFSYSISDFHRIPGFPNTSFFDNPSNLGLFRGISGGELLIQKFL